MIKPIIFILSIISASIAVSSSTEQQASPGMPNFQGSFDSTEPFKTQDPEDVQQSSQENNFQQEQQDMLQFSQLLGDFIPDQTFTLRMLPFQKYSFFLWPGAEVESIRGMFHCELSANQHDQYDVGQYLDLKILDQNSLVRQFKHQRLGVFSHPHNLKDHRYFFHFSSHEAPIDIYFSYQKISGSKKKANPQTNQTELTKAANAFKKVNRLLEQQETEMLRLMDLGDRHVGRIRNHMKEMYWRGIGQAMVLILSAFVSLWMLKRQIYGQYQQIV